ncbi:uncharacterized protein LOC130693669 [Daphnia carinata]|uniref:uncharacterized protein LOC130693669 n=1 Tax=Daphnia carinata TaxID=120202 RepID=UPI00257A2775|nr:uncharacterized protein LOC130693669 [Daphnia carinata]
MMSSQQKVIPNGSIGIEGEPGEPLSAPLIVVSNRLPFVLKRNAHGKLQRSHSAGGLVTALGPVVMDCGGLWIGWPGSHDVRPFDEIPEPDIPNSGLKSQQVKAVLVRQELFDSFYNGCCNGTFWPLFHSMPDRAVFSSDTWKAYQEVNEEFALKTIDALRQVRARLLKEYNPSDDSMPVPVVWIHDYQLMLAAAMIRQVAIEENLACKLGFFLHIPFPSWDIMRLFPWDDQILEGILACDLVGFHIEDYCANFIECCQRRMGCRVDHAKRNIEYDNRTVHVRALPIGIPFNQFQMLAIKAPRVMKDERVVLGVDRLDYTKGLVQRIKAFERLLECHPEHLGRVVLMQIAVPSRTDVKEYKALKEEIDQLVGRINGRFSTADWSPIRYIYGCISQDKLAAFYRDSAVALVTPLRDGMNLVAKEFVACQINENGVLILSPFAGAGGTMREALLVNPYEVDMVAETIHNALVMDVNERRRRMQLLRKRESSMDVDYWMDSFLREMDQVECAITGPPSLIPVDHGYQSYLTEYIEDSTKLNLLLDYDGTLAPIVSHPDLAMMSAETRRVLTHLSQMPSVSVCIMSGRSLDNLRQMVGIEGITYAASQGLEILHPDGSRFIHPVPTDHQIRLQNLLPALEGEVCTNGAWVENKGALLTYHYRALSSTTSPERRDSLVQRAAELFRQHGFYPHHTQMAIEARPPVPWDKGRASLYIMRTTYGVDWPQRVGGPERVRILYAGDDDTDEDVMEALNGLACTFRVSRVPVYKSSANYRLTDPDAVQSLLRLIEDKLDQRAVIPSSPTSSFTANFFITCIHESETVTSDEEQTDLSVSDAQLKSKRRRRNSRNSTMVLSKVAAAGLLRSNSFKAALCHHSQDPITVIGH